MGISRAKTEQQAAQGRNRVSTLVRECVRFNLAHIGYFLVQAPVHPFTEMACNM